MRYQLSIFSNKTFKSTIGIFNQFFNHASVSHNDQWFALDG